MSLEDFNTIYSELITDLMNRYSLNISLNDNPSDKRYISHFIRNIIPYMDDISCMNLDALRYKHKNIFIVNGIKLSKILKNPKFIVGSKTLWEYFHTLYILCYKAPETKTLLKNYEDIENYNMISRNLEEYYYDTFLDNFKVVLEEEDTDTDTETEDGPQIHPEKEESTTDDGAELPGFLQNSIIGNLAKEISSEIDTTQLENLENPADLFSAMFSGGAGGGLGDLIGSVVGKLTEKMESGELDQTKLMTEAAGMMGSLNLFGGGATTNNTTESTESTEQVKEEQQTRTKSKKKKRRRKKKKKVVSEES